MIHLRAWGFVALMLGVSATSLACLQEQPQVAGLQGGEEGVEHLLSAQRHVLRSSVLDEDRVIRVVTPDAAGEGRATYPTIYVLDGEANLGAVAVAARHLSAYLRVPESLVVAVHNTAREPDLNPPGLTRALPGGEDARGDRFLRFLAGELIPFVEGAYP
ncbi:MAG: hypothetical protein HKO53_01100, partial [Gemmatimonadetes bacterium]|nr:hypothetical protein [Gemmatimonadota bacterium]